MWILVLFAMSNDGIEYQYRSNAKQEFASRLECLKAGMREKSKGNAINFVCERD